MSAQSVRDTSVTGEFADLTDAAIGKFTTLICPLYKTIRGKNVGNWRELVALHVAHYLHMALLGEGAEAGGGPVSSESFAQVGSRSYAVVPLNSENWWTGSPYGVLWHQFWIAMPPALRAV